MTKRSRGSDPWTSHEAGESIEPHLGRPHALVIETIRAHGPLTADECCVLSGVPSIWRRFSELEERCLIVDTGKVRLTRTRRMARVFALKEHQLELFG